MASKTRFFTLTLGSLLLAGTLAAQSQTPVQDEPSPAAPPPAQTTQDQNPLHLEDDSTPQSAVQPQTTEPPTQDGATAPLSQSTEPATPAQPVVQTATGKVTAISAAALSLDTDPGTTLTFVVDAATSQPAEVHVGDRAIVESVTLDDGSRHANSVTLAPPQPAATVPVNANTADVAGPKPSAKPAIAHHAATPSAKLPVKPATVPEPLPIVDPIASATSPSAPAASLPSAASAAPQSAPAATTPTLALPLASTATAIRPASHMFVPLLLLAGGIAFLTVLGVRQARRRTA